ncbi:Magnesium and cobalt efflux protein CorC [Planctomycetes bacterium Pla163]|uniref:Magnesium and cobalt efflux protein CorC n=1 Tax=Rohdeia mirabilis TaxID=2528008 RepID=A0A518D1S0_9BACT|nr:Magnesium and cobalt efflux protein CorC [Planctomycetes bacterium Pla163]
MTDLWLYVVLGLLVLCSGTVSASETALFGLSQRERKQAGEAVNRLLAHPRDLLVSVLFVNLVVNILFFSFADRLTSGGGLHPVLGVVVVLIPLLLFGEVLPKTLGLRAPLPIARAVAPVMRLVVRAVWPVRMVLGRALEFLASLAGTRDERRVTPEELSLVLGRTGASGHLDMVEADLLSEVVELKTIRVREIMTPRVDALWLARDGSDRETVVAQALRERVAWLPVVDDGPDAVVGMVKLRDLLREPDRAVAELVMPVVYVPEVASALDLLRLLRGAGTSEAVCIDEWGGSAGVVTIEEVFEEIVGDLRAEGESRDVYRIVPLGERTFRVPGHFSVRDWNEYFGQRVLPVEFETVGGLVMALLGRVPRVGDEVKVGALTLEVDEVRSRRVIAIDVRVDGGDGDGRASGGNG